MHRALIRSAFAALFALGCGSRNDEPAAECAEPNPDALAPVADALALGLGTADAFTQLEAMQDAPLLRGPQGGFMITPVIRLDTSRLATDGSCDYLTLRADCVDQQPVELRLRLYGLTQRDTYLYTDALPFLLTFDPTGIDGKTCDVSATWQDASASASASVEVTLVKTE